jgi:hypothetical protein
MASLLLLGTLMLAFLLLLASQLMLAYMIAKVSAVAAALPCCSIKKSNS